MTRVVCALVALFLAAPVAAADNVLPPDICEGPQLRVQVLGSGGADLADGRAASAYLVWIDGKARLLIDAGAGSALRFTESGAHVADIDAILFTRLRFDRTLDFPALIGLAIREGRTRTLPLYGPVGNPAAPSTVTFVRALLDGTRGAYRQLSRVLSPLAKDSFKLEPHDVRTRIPVVGVRRGVKEIVEVSPSKRFRAAATYVSNGGPRVLAWRVRVGERSIVIGGDVSGGGAHLMRLARAADLLILDDPVVHKHAGTSPSAIGRIAAQMQVKRLVLAHRTAETLGTESTALAEIRKYYDGPVQFANDLNCFALP